MANLLASVAAYETEVRGERIRAGQEVARGAGDHLGGTAGIRTLVKLIREQGDLVRRMKAEGEKVARFARATGLSGVTVYRVLDRAAAAK
jgi:DNA invertase Pin-like site-specific DNA recombinase